MQARHILIGLGVLVVLVGLGWIATYNGLVSADETANEEWGDIGATLQRRSDLIPNLVSTVKGYAKHEEKVFTAVTEARSKVGQINLSQASLNPEAMKQLVEAQGQMAGALSRLLAVAENYPELKASENFLQLQSQLEGTENRINVARQRYNKAVKDLNSRVRGFFGKIVAGVHGFHTRQYFEASEKAQTVPEVTFE